MGQYFKSYLILVCIYLKELYLCLFLLPNNLLIAPAFVRASKEWEGGEHSVKKEVFSPDNNL